MLQIQNASSYEYNAVYVDISLFFLHFAASALRECSGFSAYGHIEKHSQTATKKADIQQSENFCSTGHHCLFPPWGVFGAHKKELIFRAAA